MNPDRRSFLKSAALFGAASFVTHDLSSLAEEAAKPVDATLGAYDGVVGQGDWRFKLVPNWGVQDPAKTPVNNLHEMAQAKDGKLYIIGDHLQNGVFVYEPDGTLVRTFGTDYSGGHGLTLVEENGQEFLWLVNADAKAPFTRKVTLEGEVIMELGRPDAPEYTNEKKPPRYRPTEVEINPANGDIYIADGYGSNYLSHYDKDGNLIGCYGGGAMAFDTMHGVRLDTRDPANPHLWVTSRTNNQIRRMTLDGKLMEVLHFPGAWPCRATFVGDHVLLPIIWSNSVSYGTRKDDTGFVLVLGPDNQPVSLIGGLAPDAAAAEPYYRRDRAEKLAFVNPHDAFIDKAGDLYTPQWRSFNTYPLKWERVRD